MAVIDDTIVEPRIRKLRLALEYVFFEQSKFYGKDKHGMFVINEGQKKKLDLLKE
jgi:hypothetical protein